MIRGNGGQTVFHESSDRYRFYALLQEAVERYRCRIHAFCLMDNHVHLAMQIADIPLSRCMQNISFRYTRFINIKRNKSGHLFQGRYKAIVLDADSYLLELVRYIHLNPVRAGIVKTVEKYRWSSHRAYRGEETLKWLTTDWALSIFSTREKQACRLYAEFMQQGLSEGYRAEFHKGSVDGRILGDDRFAEIALNKAGQRMSVAVTTEKVIALVSGHYGIAPEELGMGGKQRIVSEARAVAGWLVREVQGIRLTELAEKIGRDISSLSIAASRVEKRAQTDKALAQKVVELRNKLFRVPLKIDQKPVPIIPST